jgi:hypothetical protein
MSETLQLSKPLFPCHLLLGAAGSKVSETMSMDDKKLPRVRLADGQEILGMFAWP